MPLYKSCNVFQCLHEVFQGVCIGNPYKAFAAFAERTARNNGNLFFLQELFAECFAVHARAANAWEDIKCSFRIEAVQPHLIEAVYNNSPASIVFIDHFPDFIITFLQSDNGSVLAILYLQSSWQLAVRKSKRR